MLVQLVINRERMKLERIKLQQQIFQTYTHPLDVGSFILFSFPRPPCFCPNVL